jgi:hypothetical protein
MSIDKQERNLEEAVVSLFKISPQYMPKETESKTAESRSWKPVSQLRFYLRPPKYKSRVLTIKSYLNQVLQISGI